MVNIKGTSIKDKQRTFKLSNNIKFTLPPFYNYAQLSWQIMSLCSPLLEYSHGNNKGWANYPVVMVRYSLQSVSVCFLHPFIIFSLFLSFLFPSFPPHSEGIQVSFSLVQWKHPLCNVLNCILIKLFHVVPKILCVPELDVRTYPFYLTGLHQC